MYIPMKIYKVPYHSTFVKVKSDFLTRSGRLCMVVWTKLCIALHCEKNNWDVLTYAAGFLDLSKPFWMNESKILDIT